MNIVVNKDIEELIKFLTKEFNSNLVSHKINSTNHIQFVIEKNYLPSAVEYISKSSELKTHLITMLASDERISNESFKIYVTFAITQPKAILTLEVLLDKNNPSYPALSKIIPSLNWHEREIHDLFGIVPVGIELDPLVLHRDWPHGKYFPMRNDFTLNKRFPFGEVTHEFSQQPHGEGMHQIAVGPIHAGIIEPGHLRFCTIGEEIYKFDAQLFYKHKGIEKMASGKNIEEVLTLSEHVCGMCAFSHSSGFCQAVENLGNIEIPQRAAYLRTICLELERISNHMADLMSICSAGGLGFGANHAARLREVLMRLNHEFAGHRFFRNLNTIGGLKKNITDESCNLLLEKFEKFKPQFQEWEQLIINSDSLLDRLELTGFLSNENAIKLGLVGPAARASNVDIDIRRDYPYLAYEDCMVKVPVYEDGDALARTQVRIDEVYESLRIIKNLINGLPSGSIVDHTPVKYALLMPSVSMIESAKGELAHFIILDEENKISRWHVRSASYMNWRGVVQATMGQDGFKNIVPDGPLINKSFNLCYACVDR